MVAGRFQQLPSPGPSPPQPLLGARGLCGCVDVITNGFSNEGAEGGSAHPLAPASCSPSGCPSVWWEQLSPAACLERASA